MNDNNKILTHSQQLDQVLRLLHSANRDLAAGQVESARQQIVAAGRRLARVHQAIVGKPDG